MNRAIAMPSVKKHFDGQVLISRITVHMKQHFTLFG